MLTEHVFCYEDCGYGCSYVCGVDMSPTENLSDDEKKAIANVFGKVTVNTDVNPNEIDEGTRAIAAVFGNAPSIPYKPKKTKKKKPFRESNWKRKYLELLHQWQKLTD